MECSSFWTAFDSIVTAIKDLNITWAAIGSIATVVSAFAIIVAVLQLRYNAWLKAQDVFTSDEFTKARTELFKHFDCEEQPWPDPIYDEDT